MTNRIKLVVAAFCFILIASVMAPVSKAQNGDKKNSCHLQRANRNSGKRNSARRAPISSNC